MKKALFVTHVSGFVPQFEMNNVRILQGMGYEVHYAANFNQPSYGDDNSRLQGTGIVCHQIDFERSPFSRANWKALKELKELFAAESFSLVHCHTPMGGFLARAAGAPYRKTGLKMIYTAHGFHFYKGAPLKNWLLYFPAEWILSFVTDLQICINEEDYEFARRHLHAREVAYVPGVGFDPDTGLSLDRAAARRELRKEFHLPPDSIVLINAGELIPRKNQEALIRMMQELPERFRLLICGKGELKASFLRLAEELGVSGRVNFPGYRPDLMKLYCGSDLFLFPSIQEGLPRALLEAMSYGLPVICTDIRGNRDLVRGAGGILLPMRKKNLSHQFAEAVLAMEKHRGQWKSFGSKNQKAVEKFSMARVDRMMREIYQHMTDGGR